MKFLVKNLLIPLVLLTFWLIAPILVNPDNPSSIIILKHSKETFKPYLNKELHRGEVIKGEINIKENNLGVVAIRFNTFNRINSDLVIFRLKKQNENSWFYEKKYNTDQFQPNDFFTFGFPVIRDSKDKNFLFELESVRGSDGDAVAVSNIEPVLQTKYQFSRAELAGDKAAILSFVSKKIFYSFRDSDFLLFSLPYLLPFIFYMSLLLFKKRTLFSLYSLVLITFLSVFTYVSLSSLTTLFLLGLWVFLIIFNRMDSSVSLFFSFIYLLIVPLMLLIGNKYAADNLAIWTYYFLVIAACQATYELWKKPKNLIGYDSIFNLKSLNKEGKPVGFLIDLVAAILNFTLRILRSFFTYIVRFFSLSSRGKFPLFIWIAKWFLLLIVLFVFAYNKIYPSFFDDAVVLKNNSIEPYISKIEPIILHHGDKVVLFGTGFNWDRNEPAKLVTSYGEVKPDSWDNSKIIFTIPLHFPVGKFDLRVEKKNMNSDSILISNKANAKIISRTGYLDYEDLDYFHQIKFLSKETKEVNDFRNYKFGKQITAFILKLL